MLNNVVGVSLWTKNLPFITSSDLLQVGDGRLHLDRLLGCCLEIYLTFSTVVVDGLLVLHEPAQVLYVRLQEHLEDNLFRFGQNIWSPLQKGL